MDDSDSSALSSAPPTDDEKLAPIFVKVKGKAKAKHMSSPATPASPPRRKRTPSPPHEESLADHPYIAFIIMFRSRFTSAFPPKLPHFGPQDIERGVEGEAPSPQVENLLCALLGLLLNRKKPVERGHHGRALEEAIATQKPHWPQSWNGVNPLHGSRNFHTMSPVERLDLLRTLVLWSLASSEVISQTIKDSYKGSRHEDDLNQPLSVQPWGIDSDKRRYFLIEGQDDTDFRLYREGVRGIKDTTWWNVAGTIDEIKAVSDKLEKDGSQAARRLSSKILAAIPRFEATEEKRRRREYRQVQKQRFSRPEPGFSLYEGRTRGKRMRYTFDDEDDFQELDESSLRRSNRNSDRSTPAEGPTVTASGRTVRPRGGGMYGESLLSGQATDEATPDDFDGSETSDAPHAGARGTRASGRLGDIDGSRKRKMVEGYNDVDGMSDEEDAASSGGWNSADNQEDGDEDVEMEEEDEERVLSEDDDDVNESLIVKLKVPRLGSARKEESDLEANTDGATQSTAIAMSTAPREPLETNGHTLKTEDAKPVLQVTSGHIPLPDSAETGSTAAATRQSAMESLKTSTQAISSTGMTSEAKDTGLSSADSHPQLSMNGVAHSDAPMSAMPATNGAHVAH